MRTINVYAPFTGTQRLPEQVDDLRKTIDPGATKAFRKEFLLTPSAYNTDGKVTVGRIEDFKSNVLSCQYPECTLNDTF